MAKCGANKGTVPWKKEYTDLLAKVTEWEQKENAYIEAIDKLTDYASELDKKLTSTSMELIKEKVRRNDLLAKVSEQEKEIENKNGRIKRLDSENWRLIEELDKTDRKVSEQSQRIQQLEGLLKEALPLLSYTGYNGIAKKIEALLKSST